MKSLKSRLSIIILAIPVFVSCESYLEEEPRDFVSPDNFFTTAGEVKTAVTGLYDIFLERSLHANIGLQRFYENGADVIGPSRLFGQVEPVQSYSLSESNISAISQNGGAPLTWQNLYRIIQNANLILANLSENTTISPSESDQLRGETLFLRAYAYYHLTNLWGNVPFFTDPVGVDEIKTLGREDMNMIRSSILVDLQESQDKLSSDYPNAELGRASKWVAAIVIVKIHLIEQNWQAARDKAVEIINDSPHSLLDTYADVFDPNNEYNIENIWELDLVKDINSDNFPDQFTPRIRDEPADADQKDALSAALAERGEGFTGFGLAVPLPDFVNEFPLDDLRRPSNIVTSYLGFELKFPYMPKLWNLDQVNSPRGNHGDNKIIFRLADVLLMAAEAENELNGPTNAYQYINMVRERAYEPDQPYSGLSQTELRQAIYDERRWELGGEGHRRMDLIRWGILEDVVKSTEYRVWNPASNIQPYHVLLPIPPEEFVLNPALLASDPSNNGYR